MFIKNTVFLIIFLLTECGQVKKTSCYVPLDTLWVITGTILQVVSPNNSVTALKDDG